LYSLWGKLIFDAVNLRVELRVLVTDFSPQQAHKENRSLLMLVILSFGKSCDLFLKLKPCYLVRK
jgi:predicted membrane chloride channel (bestrophin family)